MSNYSKLLLIGLCLAAVLLACGTDDKITRTDNSWSDIPEEPGYQTDLIPVGFYHTPGPAVGVFVRDNYCYVADAVNGLYILDVSVPESPQLLGQASVANAHRVSVFGNYAFLSEVGQGLPIIEVTDPTNPELVNIYSDALFGDGHFSNDVLYLSGSNRIRSLNVNDPRDPVELGFLSILEFGRDLTIWGDYAYIAQGMSGLAVANIANPMAMVLTRNYDLPGSASDVCMNFHGTTVFVAVGDLGVQAVDITSPSQPSVASTITLASPVYGLAVERDYLFLAADNSGIVVYNVAKSDAPQMVNSFADNSRTHGVCVQNGYVYAADINKGLMILKFKS